MLHNHCYHCKDRVVGCHSTCEKYKKFKEELEVVRAEKEKEHQLRDQRYRAIFRRSEECRFYYSKGVKYKY